MKTIITIDDEPIHNLRLKSVFDEHYEVEAFTSPVESLSYLKNQPKEALPIAIFLDVIMPELDGLSLCKEIKQIEGLENCPIIIVSSKDSVEDTIAGYEAGAVDYIPKNLDKVSLEHKLRSILKQQTRFIDLSIEKASATQFAFELMTNASEMGEIVRFVQSLEQVSTVEALSEAVLTFFDAIGLTVITAIRMGETHVASNKGVIRPIEQQLMEELERAERIFTFGNRLVFNTDALSFLILNMPIEDEAKMGRYRDHLSFIIQACETKLQNLLLIQSEQAKSQMIQKLVEDADMLLAPLESLQVSYKAIVDNLMQDMEEAFMSLGLTETQEAHLLGLMTKMDTETSALFEDAEHIASALRQIAAH
jgi:DNA-binding response OmpR family regulator